MLVNQTELPKKGVNIAHININSLRNKLNEVENLLYNNNVYILAISETHLDPTYEDSMLLIQGYNIYRKDRNKYGGGVAFYIKESLPVKIRADLMTPNLELLWLQVHIPHSKSLLIACCYRPPSAECAYLDELYGVMDKGCISGFEVYFVGDLNIDWLSQSCPLKTKLSNMANSCGLTQIINKPTRTWLKGDGSCSSTCIDHVFTNVPELCSAILSIPVGYSDHNLIIISRRLKITKVCSKMICKRSYKSFKKESFISDIKNSSWSNVLSKTDPDDALQEFNDMFMKLIEKHAPLKRFVVRATGTPWLDKEIKECMKNRDDAKKTAIITGNQSDWKLYRQLRNAVTKLNRNKKKIYYEKEINNIKNNNKKMWNIINNLLGRNRTIAPSFLDAGDHFLFKDKDIADHLNNYFVSKVDNLRKSFSNNYTNNSLLIIKDKIMKDKICTFKLKKVNIDDVKNILKKQENKPPGIDGLDNKLLQLVVDDVAPVLCHIFNLSLSHCVCPTEWKKAKIIPIPKSKSSSFSCSNSRPISLLPLLSKVMERVVSDQIKQYFITNCLLTDHQHAYRRGYSTSTALTQMTDDWHRQIDQKNIVGAVMLDFSAAFDIINHQLLLDKLKCYGFEASSLQWLKSYLTKRSQSVFFNGCYSDSSAVTCGVPQGSCLGPLLYSIFTNDLPFVLDKATAVMYADDTTVYVSAKTIEEVNLGLNKELQAVVNWIQQNHLVLNIAKTNCIVIGSRVSVCKNPELKLFIKDECIQQVSEAKMLGVIIDDKLSWKQHINKISIRMCGIMASVKRCAPFLHQSALKQLFQALLLSNLDYCPIIWSNANADLIDKLQKTQNRAARIILNRDYRANVKQMHIDLKWLFVKDRLRYSLLNFVRNVSETQTPLILYNQLKFSKDKHEYNTRHANARNFTLPKVKSNAMQRTVAYRGMYEWNRLPKQISQINSKNLFKSTLKEYLRTNHTSVE